LAVIVHSVAANLGPTGVYPWVIVITIGTQTAPTSAIAILVSILAISRQHEVSSIAVLVNAVARNIACTGIDRIVSVVAVKRKAAITFAKAVSVFIAIAAGRAGSILPVAVLITPIATNLRRPWVNIGVSVVTVDPVTAATDAEPINIAVCAIHEARGVASRTVVIFSVAASF
jgi:hypothetical protein